MTNKLNITPEAERDILAITSNIVLQNSVEAAKKTLLEFKKQLNALSDFPDSGREGGREGTREIVMEGFPYVTVFKNSDTSITIVRILYASDDRQHPQRVGC